MLLLSYRLLGTPNETIWPGVSALHGWEKFDQHTPQDLALKVPGLGADGLDLLAVSLWFNRILPIQLFCSSSQII